MSDKPKINKINGSKFDATRAAKFDLTRAKGNLASRSIPERITNVDAESRTAEFAFASDKAIEHWFGFLILDTKKESVIVDRVLQGVCPHLVNHDTNQQVGVVLSDSLSLGSEVRGKVKFSRSKQGEEIFQDVIDEIRNGVSFGFLVHELVMESEKDGIPTYRATLWEILETTSASIPADISVGMGRELYYSSETEETETLDSNKNSNSDAPAERSANSNQKETQMENEKENTPAAGEENRSANNPAPAPSGAVAAARELVELGEIFGDVELAREFAQDGKSVADFRAALQAKRAKPATEIEPKQPQVQLARTVSRTNLQAFKGERAAENALRFGHFLRAVLKNSGESREYCKTNGISLNRAHGSSTNEGGGVFVPEEFENVLIDLRLQYGVFRRNANVVPMASESKTRPRRKGGLQAYPIGAVGESRRLKESKMGWDTVNLLAKKWGVLAKQEDEWSEDALISTADVLASEIAYAFTRAEDECGFYGDGTADFHGIVGVINKLKNLSGTVANIAGLQVASGNQWAEITLADILALVGRLPSFARQSGMVKWYCSNEFYSTVLCRIALAAGGNNAANIQGAQGEMFLGKPVEIVETMPHSEDNSQIPLLYGNLSQAAMFGDRRGVTIKMTDSNDKDFEYDLEAIKGTERFDINVHDVGNADAVAKNRLAGPIVGLITAAN